MNTPRPTCKTCGKTSDAKLVDTPTGTAPSHPDDWFSWNYCNPTCRSEATR